MTVCGRQLDSLPEPTHYKNLSAPDEVGFCYCKLSRSGLLLTRALEVSRNLYFTLRISTSFRISILKKMLNTFFLWFNKFTKPIPINESSSLSRWLKSVQVIKFNNISKTWDYTHPLLLYILISYHISEKSDENCITRK